MKLLLCSFVVLLSVPVLAKPKPTVDTLDVATIIERSEKAYHGLKIYLDSGKVITAFSNTGLKNKTAKYFKTAYAADGGFNFEYYELGKSNSLYTINRTQGVVKSWWGITNKLTDPVPSLRSALSTMIGVSSGISTTIPGILLTNDFDYKGTFYHGLGDTELAGSEMVNGIDCYKMKSVSRNGRKYITWVAKKDFLIRKIEIQYTVYPASEQAFKQKLDSLAKLKISTNDTSAAKMDSIKKLSNRLMYDMAHISKSQDKTGSFDVDETYFYYPCTLKTPNPELFKFRPNREIEL